MLESGSKFAHLIQFTHGAPTSDLDYTLYNQDGDEVLSASVAVSSNQVSHLVEIAGSNNILSKPMFEQMKLEWSYTTATQAVTESVSYTIVARIPFPVTNDGVRKLLGVDRSELPDDDIDLLAAYMTFQANFLDPATLAIHEDAGTLIAYRVTGAIEAVAALAIFPTLQIRLPKKYDSGTSAYERWTTIDWALLYSGIASKISDALVLVDPTLDIFPVTDIFTLSDRGTDAITGA